MKKIIYSILLLDVIVSLIYFVLWEFISDKVILMVLNFVLIFVLLMVSIMYFQKKNEGLLITKISEHLKKILPNNDFKFNIQDVERLIQQVDMIEEEIKKERERFRNIDSYRKEYLGNVSHELKTPLFNVQGYISTLLDGAYEDNEILLEYLKKTDKNIQRMINMIDDMETISQLESGAMILDYDLFDLEQLVNEVFDQMELEAQKKNIQLRQLKDDQLNYVVVNADKFRIRQVLSNLISNSIKYGRENGHTIVTMKRKENKILAVVTDDGIGIEANHLPRVFERFYRVDKGRSRAQGGTGLGLAIVKHIIEAHKQSIYVQSEPDKGTSFTFSLEQG